MFLSEPDKNHLESTGAANCSSSAATKPCSQARLQGDEYDDDDDDDEDDEDEQFAAPVDSR